MTKNLKIGIIGGGIFGVTAAIYLSNFAKKIIIFEKNKDILLGATKFNHNRHHYGYHYPRSYETAQQCLYAKDTFNQIYLKALDFDFKNYYAIAKENSKINFDDFENFCANNKIKAIKVDIPDRIFNKKNISKCYLVEEGIYNYEILKKVLKKRLNQISNIQVLKKSPVNVYLDETKEVKLGKDKKKFNFDLIINATYDNINEHIIGKKNKIKMEYNLQEMCKINIPGERFGATVLDGYFPSILPNSGFKGQYLFAHAKYSQLIKLKSQSKPNSFNMPENFLSNRREIFTKSKKYLKILNNSTYDSSFLWTRAVNIDALKDSRKSEIIVHKNGNITIFSGKIISAEHIGLKLSEYVSKKY